LAEELNAAAEKNENLLLDDQIDEQMDTYTYLWVVYIDEFRFGGLGNHESDVFYSLTAVNSS
jgi:hypothetical protein